MLKDEVTLVMVPVNTRREVLLDEQSTTIRDWASRISAGEVPDEFEAELAKYLDDCTEDIPCTQTDWVRGYDHESYSGPPPDDKCGEGRYNEKGSAVLYLCDSEEGVRLEFRRQAAELNKLETIRIANREHRLRVADFTRLAHDHFLQQVFHVAEMCHIETRPQYPQSYKFPQYIADNVRKSGFDGMLVCGAGCESKEETPYTNLVIFEPWRTGDWTDLASVVNT